MLFARESKAGEKMNGLLLYTHVVVKTWRLSFQMCCRTCNSAQLTFFFLTNDILALWLCCKGPCKRSNHCWAQHVASVCTPCCVLLRLVGSCRMKFETGQTSEPTSANISIVSRSSKRGPTMLRSFAQHIQQCCASARALHATYPHKYMRTRNQHGVGDGKRPRVLCILRPNM